MAWPARPESRDGGISGSTKGYLVWPNIIGTGERCASRFGACLPLLPPVGQVRGRRKTGTFGHGPGRQPGIDSANRANKAIIRAAIGGTGWGNRAERVCAVFARS